MVCKGKFGVKNRTKECCFFDNFDRRLVQYDSRFWRRNKTPCLQKCIHTVLQVEIRKPFSESKCCTPLTHNCMALSTLCTNLPRIHKVQSSTNKEESLPLKADLTILFILMLNRAGYRMLPWVTPISCSCSSDFKKSVGYKFINTIWKMPSETKDPEIWKNAVFPGRIVRLFQVKENARTCCFCTQASRIKVSKRTR